MNILDLFTESGMVIKKYIDAAAQWEYVLANARFVPVNYSLAMVEYQSAYIKEVSEEYSNLSMIIYDGKEPVAVWPLCIYRSNSKWFVGSNEGAVIPPLFIDSCNEKKMKLITHSCFKALSNLCAIYGLDYWEGNQAIREEGLGFWHRSVMEKGKIKNIRHILYVDLSMDNSVIKANFRKSYKALISKGLRLWNTRIYSGCIADDEFQRFRDMHFMVAGRYTRSAHTWELQQKAVLNGDAFIISLEDREGVLVGFGLFYHTKDEGVYAVGVYDRSLFNEPLGHVVQIKAIEYMKSQGIKWYKIGYRPYPYDIDQPSEKELNIGLFKEGFATHLFLDIQTVSIIANKGIPVRKNNEL